MADGFIITGELVDETEQRTVFDIYHGDAPAVRKRGVITFEALEALAPSSYPNVIQIFDTHRATIASKAGDIWLANPENDFVLLDRSDF